MSGCPQADYLAWVLLGGAGAIFVLNVIDHLRLRAIRRDYTRMATEMDLWLKGTWHEHPP